MTDTNNHYEQNVTNIHPREEAMSPSQHRRTLTKEPAHYLPADMSV